MSRDSVSCPNTVFLVDGSGYLPWPIYALPPMTDDGTPVNAVYGFTNMLWKLLEDTDADYVAAALDEAEKLDRKSTTATRSIARRRRKDLIPTCPAGSDGGAEHPCRLHGGLRGGRLDRHLCPAGGSGRRGGDHRFVGQGPHAVGRPGAP